MALQVNGVAGFARSGLVTVPAGTKTATVGQVPLTASSLVLALAQQSMGGAFVKSAVPDPPNSRFTINLNKAPGVDVPVGWFIAN